MAYIRTYSELTKDYLLDKFAYDPESGQLTHKLRTNKNKPGDIVGSLTKNGYFRVKINGISYYVHRLIWLMVTGKHIPADLEVDHIDGNRSNNKWINLRLADRNENCWNYTRQKISTTKIKGVTFNKKAGTYRARIKHLGVRIHLGNFAKLEDAAKAYEQAAKYLFGEFAKI